MSSLNDILARAIERGNASRASEGGSTPLQGDVGSRKTPTPLEVGADSADSTQEQSQLDVALTQDDLEADLSPDEELVDSPTLAGPPLIAATLPWKKVRRHVEDELGVLGHSVRHDELDLSALTRVRGQVRRLGWECKLAREKLDDITHQPIQPSTRRGYIREADVEIVRVARLLELVELRLQDGPGSNRPSPAVASARDPAEMLASQADDTVAATAAAIGVSFRARRARAPKEVAAEAATPRPSGSGHKPRSLQLEAPEDEDSLGFKEIGRASCRERV